MPDLVSELAERGRALSLEDRSRLAELLLARATFGGNRSSLGHRDRETHRCI